MLSAAVCLCAAPKPLQLKCEYETNPLGVDTARPRFGWIGEALQRDKFQNAYQIQVGNSARNFDLWNTGKVKSRSQMAVYAGPPLRPASAYFWRVRLWNSQRQAGPWSEAARFETGMFAQADWQGAKWIAWRGHDRWRREWDARKKQEWAKYKAPRMTPAATTIDKNPFELLTLTDPPYDPSPLLRKPFQLSAPIRKARLYISGVGYYVAALNGRRIGDQVLDPGWTNYQHRVLYHVHDVTALVRSGDNVLGVMLGNGYYGQRSNDRWGFWTGPWIDQPSLIALLVVESADGSRKVVATDQTWKAAGGPVLYDDPWLGETYDAREEHNGWDKPGYDDSKWEAAHLAPGPKGVLKAQLVAPIRPVKSIPPAAQEQVAPGVWDIDLGRNIAGWMRLTLRGPAGTRVWVRMAEKPDAKSFTDRTTGNWQQFGYVLKGSGEEVAEPHFAYMGFRYARITALDNPGQVELKHAAGIFVHTDVASAGSFECSNQLINRINSMWRVTQLNNMHSIPTDCPHREKLGWMADAHVVEEAAIFSFDMPSFYEKYAHDVSETQDERGVLSTVAPSYGYSMGVSPVWAASVALIPWRLYEYYGNSRILETEYPAIVKWLDATLKNNAVAGKPFIIEDAHGDWASPAGNTPPEGRQVYGTAYFYRCSRVAARMAEMRGDKQAAAALDKRAEQVKEAFNREFYDAEQHIYHGNLKTGYRQAVNAVALGFGLVPESRQAAVFENLCRDVEAKDYHLNTGFIGYKPLLEVLTDHGRADLAYRIITQETQPGWGWMLAQGATTMWEDWAGRASYDHPMQGAVVDYFYRYLAGIRIDDAHPAFERFTIAPVTPKGLDSVNAEYNSIRGKIVSRWKKQAGAFTLEVTVPFNTTAEVRVPVDDAARCAATGDKGAGAGKAQGKAVAFTVGSGSYTFRAACQQYTGPRL